MRIYELHGLQAFLSMCVQAFVMDQLPGCPQSSAQQFIAVAAFNIYDQLPNYNRSLKKLCLTAYSKKEEKREVSSREYGRPSSPKNTFSKNSPGYHGYRTPHVTIYIYIYVTKNRCC